MLFCTNETTLEALIESNIATPLSIKFNGVDYEVAQKTMCICSHLVKEMINDNLCERVELNQKYVSTDVFEMLLPFFNSGFIGDDLKWNPNTIVEALLLSDYLQATALHDWAIDHIVEHQIFNGSLFHHTALPFRLFEELLLKCNDVYIESGRSNCILLDMWTEYTYCNPCDEAFEVCNKAREHLSRIKIGALHYSGILSKLRRAMKHAPDAVIDSLSIRGIVQHQLQERRRYRYREDLPDSDSD